MFAFEIWGKFASFRDPFTISQNISLPIPPKSTVAGMMASILGREDYLEDDAFDFEYSLVVLNPVRKKSFSQNYINDYTAKTQTQINNLKKHDFEKVATGLRDKKNPQKPINRELILYPRYLIFIKGFRYKEEMVENLQNKISKFPFYLGNSEFAGNFKYIKIKSYQLLVLQKDSIAIDSFISEEDLEHIFFQDNIGYSTLTFSTKLDKKRAPVAMKSVITANDKISVKDIKDIYKIKTNDREYFCRFIS